MTVCSLQACFCCDRQPELAQLSQDLLGSCNSAMSWDATHWSLMRPSGPIRYRRLCNDKWDDDKADHVAPG